MRRTAAIFAALVLFSAIAFSTSALAAEGRIYVMSGSVFVAQGKNPAHQVANTEAISANTLIYTGAESAALLRFEDGQVVTMQANSTFKVREYRYDAKNAKNGSAVFLMLKGGMRFITGLIGQSKKEAFRLLTPHSTIGIRGTEFMVAMVDNTVYSQVLEGKIGLTNSAGTVVLGAGQTAVLASSAALASIVPSYTIPESVFSELLSIPVQSSAISTPATATSAAQFPLPEVAPEAGGEVAAAGEADLAAGAPSALAGSGDGDKDSPADGSAAQSRFGTAVSAKAGTLGYGGDLTFGNDSISGRLGFNKYRNRYKGSTDSINFDLKLQMQTITALADWYPFGGAFRISGGLVNNKNFAEMKATPDANANFTINGQTYSATTAVGSLQGRISFRPAAPYLGIGWGNPVAKDKGWGLVSDVGVLFHGTPELTMTVTCAAALSAAQCAQLQADVAAEQAKQQTDLNKNLKKWPVVSIGLTYQW